MFSIFHSQDEGSESHISTKIEIILPRFLIFEPNKNIYKNIKYMSDIKHNTNNICDNSIPKNIIQRKYDSIP